MENNIADKVVNGEEEIANTDSVIEHVETVGGIDSVVEQKLISKDEKADNGINVDVVDAINGHFNSVRNMLKFNKDKDANINKLTSELQLYRDGLEMKLFRSIALNLIGLREDCKKSLREFSSRGLTIDESKKYLNYLVYDFEDLLTNLNIKVDGENVFYNNKLITLGFDKKIKVCEVQEFILPDVPKLNSYESLDVIEYLKAIENYILEVLKNQANFDKVLKTYIENSSLYEEGIHQVILYPIVNKLSVGYLAIKVEVEKSIENLSEENSTTLFSCVSNKMIELLDSVLVQCNVTIESFVSDIYDTQKHRLLKTIPTDVQSENGRVDKIYTDCYLMETKVIYPQKVDVLKYQEKK